MWDFESLRMRLCKPTEFWLPQLWGQDFKVFLMPAQGVQLLRRSVSSEVKIPSKSLYYSYIYI